MPKKKEAKEEGKRIAKRYPALAIAWIVLDQMVKVSIRSGVPYREMLPFLPGLDLTFVKNTGAAFSMFSNQTWILTVFSAVVSVLLTVVLLRDLLPHWRARLALSLLLGGAVGNFIDRLLLGYVTDMFATTFINFAVFNVADIGVVVGGILLCIHVILLWKDTPDEKPGENSGHPKKTKTPETPAPKQKGAKGS